MSYNIIASEVLESDNFCLPAQKKESVLSKVEKESLVLAEASFVDQIQEQLDCTIKENGDVEFHNLWWYGSFSGRCFDNLLDVLKETTGTAKILLTWEDGEQAGLEVKNGKVAKCSVEYHFVNKKKV